jgi:hypothetical protein
MKWDVVEVRPETGFWLYLRFQDGVQGRVRLNPAQFKGELEALRDPGLFAQAGVDNGFLSWPGGIRVSPDALHAHLTRDNDLTIY